MPPATAFTPASAARPGYRASLISCSHEFTEGTTMKLRIALLGLVSLVAMAISTPAHLQGQQTPDAQQHEQHRAGTAAPPAQAAAGQQADMAKMMAAMKATDLKV